MKLNLDDVVVLDREFVLDKKISLSAVGLAAWILAQESDFPLRLTKYEVSQQLQVSPEAAQAMLDELSIAGMMGWTEEAVKVYEPTIVIAEATEVAANAAIEAEGYDTEDEDEDDDYDEYLSQE